LFLTGKDGLPVKKFVSFLLILGMLFTVGFSTVGCSKGDKAGDKKAADKKADEKKADDKKP
jgi:hypothetical protein